MNRIRLLPLALVPMVLSTAAVPLPGPALVPISTTLRDRIIAEASALPPERLAFERASSAVRTGGGTTSTTRLTERWNGKAWSLVSIHDRAPSATQRRDHKRLMQAIPVPGYYQLGPIVAAATGSSSDAQGRTLLTVPVMPAGSVHTDNGDISSHLKGEARLVRRGDAIWVDQLKVTAREAFKMNMLIRVIGFEQTSEYTPGTDGKPRLTSQTSHSTGTMFGFPGGEKAQASFVYR